MGFRITPKVWIWAPKPKPYGPGYKMAAPRTGTRYSNMAAEMETRDKYYNLSPMVIPPPITDYKAGDRVSKQFPNTCGPYPEVPGMGCGEAVTSFEGTITGNTSDITLEGGGGTFQEFEVEWDMKPGMPTYPMYSYENPSNLFLVSRSMVSSAPTSQADCREGETFIQAVYPPCNIDVDNTGQGEVCPPVTPAYCSSEVIRPTGDITPTTAGTTSKSILPILIIGGLMYYLYTKNK